MSTRADERVWPGVGWYVEAYESARAGDGHADIGEFAPPVDHPDRLGILCELVRVDLEYQLERPDGRRLDAYRELFPEVFVDTRLVAAMAFEEYRLRAQAGEPVTPADYAAQYGIGTDGWAPGVVVETGAAAMSRAASAYRSYRRGVGDHPGSLADVLESYRVAPETAELLQSLDRVDPHAAERLAEGLSGFPRVGGRFLGFELSGELGRGAFGRVYLARQGDLADRLVALKVTTEPSGESRALARLQHTNIVPIYSVHRRGPLHVVCMPYLGGTTLADTLATLRSQPALPRSGEGLVSSLRVGAGGVGSRPVGGSNPAPGAEASSTRDSSSTSDTVEPAPQVETAAAIAEPTSPQVERLRGLGYVPAVLWVMARVAEGLAHAHERGILHRDLKPANILFSDDGEPLLLDFNLAADVHAPLGASVALVGGTLPYMAPEHLRAFRDGTTAVDARGDIYALGVILHELLTGAHPFPLRKGVVDAVLPEMLADREGPVPDVCKANPAVSPAVAAIVGHCLHPDPARRYPSARALHEDLRRQLDDLPLKHAPEPLGRERMAKWVRRHPRLTSSTTVGLVAGVLLLGVVAGFLSRQRHFDRLAAEAALSQVVSNRSEAFALLADPGGAPELVAEGLTLVRGTATRYGIDAGARWREGTLVTRLSEPDQARLRASLGELLALGGRALARAAQSQDDPNSARAEAGRWLDGATACHPADAPPRALLEARADLARAEGAPAETIARLQSRAAAVPPRSPRERLLEVADRGTVENRRQLAAFLDAAESLGPADLDPSHWLVLGHWSVRLGRPDDALHAFGVAIALAPRLPWPWFSRGLLALDTNDPAQAEHDFDRVITLRPSLPAAYLNRALARLALEKVEPALDDVTYCLAFPDAPARAWFVSAKIRDRLGDRAGARRDRENGMKTPPRDPDGYVARGLARLPGDPRGALADFDAALALAPNHRSALQDRASVLSESLGRAEEAIATLDRAVTHHPSYVESRIGRGVLLARLGRRGPAHEDARQSLAQDRRALILYQAACIYSLTSKDHPEDRAEALRLLAESFRADHSWLAVAPRDPDLARLHADPAFRALLK